MLKFAFHGIKIYTDLLIGLQAYRGDKKYIGNTAIYDWEVKYRKSNTTPCPPIYIQNPVNGRLWANLGFQKNRFPEC